MGGRTAHLRCAAAVLAIAVGGGALSASEAPATAVGGTAWSAAGGSAAPNLGGYPWKQRRKAAIRFALRRDDVVAFAIIDERGRLHGWRVNQGFPSASVVKAMLLVAYLRQPEVRRRRLSGADKNLLRPMIRRSDNPTASAVYGRIGGNAGLNRLARAAEMKRFRPDSVWGLSNITAKDQARFFYRLERFIPRRHRDFAIELLTQVVRPQRWGIPRGKPDHWQIHFKGGFVPEGSGWKVHQVALLRRGTDRRLSLCVLTRYNRSLGYGARTIEGVTARLLGGYNGITNP